MRRGKPGRPRLVGRGQPLSAGKPAGYEADSRSVADGLATLTTGNKADYEKLKKRRVEVAELKKSTAMDRLTGGRAGAIRAKRHHLDR